MAVGHLPQGWRLGLLLASGLFLALALAAAGAADQGIDWNRARELLQRSNRGETLSPEDRAYLDMARQARQAQAAVVMQATPEQERTGLVSLTEMGEGKYKEEDGGLYGGGSNVPPAAHREAALKEAARTRPLDAEGRPSPDGKIVLISVGMSNTSQEFGPFKRLADADPAKSPHVVIVNGAQGGKDAGSWANALTRPAPAGQQPSPWDVLDERLKAAGVTGPQVQAAWIKQACAGPARFGQFPDHARVLQRDMAIILNELKRRYPSLRIAFLSSRIYAGYATTPLNPEPYAYEGAFAVRWLIQDQIKGVPELNYMPERGEVKAPLVLWGPYLWGDGLTARKADGLVWKREDLGGDGTHPSRSGQQKVADLLLEFFKTDPAARGWFVAPPAAGQGAQGPAPGSADHPLPPYIGG